MKHFNWQLWTFLGVVAWLLIVGSIHRQERSECLRWQEWQGNQLMQVITGEIRPNDRWHAAHWQKEQCRRYTDDDTHRSIVLY